MEKNNILTEYQQKIVNKMGFFAMTRSRIGGGNGKVNGDYFLESTPVPAQFIYWMFYINTTIKAVFLVFLVADYFGPVLFLDKIAALDYILCVGIVTLGSCIWFPRYPLHGRDSGIFSDRDNLIHLCLVTSSVLFPLRNPSQSVEN